MKTNLSFDSISWSKIVGSKSENIAVVTFGEPCGLLVPLPAYEKRVNVSKDCRALYLDQLQKGDASRYTAEITSQNNTVVNESFDLTVSSKYPNGQANVASHTGCQGERGRWALKLEYPERPLPGSDGTSWSHKLIREESLHDRVGFLLPCYLRG